MRLLGTDLDPAPLETAERNLEAARAHYAEALKGTSAALVACDFREARRRLPEVRDGRVSLIISNPPLGRRVQVANLHALFADLFALAASALRDDGRLVIINPLRVSPARGSPLRCESQRTVDLGLRRGCSVEVWRKASGSVARYSRQGRAHVPRSASSLTL